MSPDLALHAALAGLSILAGLQDWRKREVSDLLTWPLFVLGLLAALLRLARLDLLPLLVIAFVLAAWHFHWLGGADVRVFAGLWGLWPAAGLWGLAAAGLWGLTLVLMRRGKERFPALTPAAVGAAVQLFIELFESFSITAQCRHF